MKIKYFPQLSLIVAFITLSTTAVSQNLKITGTVYDSSGSIALQKSVVSLVRLNDSSLVSFQRTGAAGTFEFEVPLDTFIVIIEHPQFDSKTLYV
ncbi:MAG: carboxypeptidase regulatory-like domain-containing protein, partial [Flavobacteriales bacterium]|nr:carboxypeptidase regulatory-like domain-containing protein [Flavobacteriales bacterium]